MSEPEAATVTEDKATEGQQEGHEEPEATEQEVQEAFEAGMSKAANPHDGVEAEPQVPQKVLLGYTEEELKAILDKAKEVDSVKELAATETRKLYGRLGEFQSELKKLREGTTAGQPVKVTSDKLKRLHSEYPEIAEMLAEDLSSVVLSQVSTSADMSQVEQLVNTKLGEATRAYEMKLLKKDHPDWEQVVKSTEFGTWLASKPKEEQYRIRLSDDSEVAGEAISEFKQYRKAQAPPATRGGNKRLEAAITPRGVPSPSVGNSRPASYEDAFNAGMRKARTG